ncbi:unnamed protein product [Trichobilharzia regenti]|nr:unnamed protein product [Trichobilharzia regenti]
MIWLRAAIGVARLLVQAIMEEGLSEAEAKSRIYMMDSHGLVVTVSGNKVHLFSNIDFHEFDWFTGLIMNCSYQLERWRPTIVIFLDLPESAIRFCRPRSTMTVLGCEGNAEKIHCTDQVTLLELMPSEPGESLRRVVI